MNIEKIKKIAKYVTNILCAVSFVIVGVNAVPGITIPYCEQINGVLEVVIKAIGVYLLGNTVTKAVKAINDK